MNSSTSAAFTAASGTAADAASAAAQAVATAISSAARAVAAAPRDCPQCPVLRRNCRTLQTQNNALVRHNNTLARLQSRVRERERRRSTTSEDDDSSETVPETDIDSDYKDSHPQSRHRQFTPHTPTSPSYTPTSPSYSPVDPTPLELAAYAANEDAADVAARAWIAAYAIAYDGSTTEDDDECKIIAAPPAPPRIVIDLTSSPVPPTRVLRSQVRRTLEFYGAQHRDPCPSSPEARCKRVRRS